MTEQTIRFLQHDGRRLAWATSGQGPPLVIGGWWLAHLDLNWNDPRYRAFADALGRYRTVVRYDRPGAGIAADGGPLPSGLDEELAILECVVAAAEGLDLGRVDVLGGSSGAALAAALAAANPGRFRRAVLYAGYANGREIADDGARETLVGIVRDHWGVGSRVLADVFLPSATGAERQEFSLFQRESASPEFAAATLAAAYEIDVRDRLDGIDVPVQVLHRRDDRAIPVALGQDLAARIDGASFRQLDGNEHFPWRGDSAALATAILAGLGVEEPKVEIRAAAEATAAAVEEHDEASAADSELSARELEILKLVASGLSDREIAERLVLSPHTVHRHVANVRTKLRLPSRAAAAAYAVRQRLI